MIFKDRTCLTSFKIGSCVMGYSATANNLLSYGLKGKKVLNDDT